MSSEVHIEPTAYSDIKKWAAIRCYLEVIGQPVTFRELVPVMRRGGMQLPTKDDNAYEILRIVVSQNSGPDGKRDWPLRFHREGDLVGLIQWRKPPLKPPIAFLAPSHDDRKP